MVTYTLTVQSTPIGIEMKVQVLGLSFWRVTNFSEDYDSGTVITVTAPATMGEPIGTSELSWYFKKWENNSTDPKRVVTLSTDTTIIATYEQQKYFPTRRPDRRKDKYEGKVDEDVYASRTTALKDMMVSQIEVTTAQQTRIEELVGAYLNKQDLYGTQIHHFRNFSQELFGLVRIFSNTALNKEASLKAQKWVTRLTADGMLEADVKTHLQEIANLFNITLTYP